MKFISFVATMALPHLYAPRLTAAFSPICPFSLASSCPSSPGTRLKADLITFDLDDTIFPVGPVVHDANKALIEHLNENGYDKITQETLIASTKLIRNELLEKENKVITYTELRKRAICFEMNKRGNKDLSTIETENKDGKVVEILFSDSIVVEAYDFWEANRHLAAENHLYHDTIPMLQSLKETYPNAIIGAITNGKGNPLHMKQTIHQFFDFCISGEDDNVFPYRKPHEGIYMKSLDYFYDLKGIKQKDEKESQRWIHVGDDLANDVGASAKCGANAIWVDLDCNEYSQSASKRFDKPKKGEDSSSNDQNAQPFWSTATKEEIEKRKKMNDESMKFVSARIEKLSDLPRVINNEIMESKMTR